MNTLWMDCGQVSQPVDSNLSVLMVWRKGTMGPQVK